MRFEIKASRQLSPDERILQSRLSAEAFPPDGDTTQWAEDSDWFVLVWEGQELVSNVGILERTITVGGQPVRVGGIGGVATGLAWRGRGFAGQAMKASAIFMHDTLAVEFGLLVCDTHMVPYYGKLGWQLVNCHTWMEQPQGKEPFTDPVMVLPVCKQDWPEGEIDLCGLPW
jgi:aminoglycoside 2'-N-acetyltransferase I